MEKFHEKGGKSVDEFLSSLTQGQRECLWGRFSRARDALKDEKAAELWNQTCKGKGSDGPKKQLLKVFLDTKGDLKKGNLFQKELIQLSQTAGGLDASLQWPCLFVCTCVPPKVARKPRSGVPFQSILTRFGLKEAMRRVPWKTLAHQCHAACCFSFDCSTSSTPSLPRCPGAIFLAEEIPETNMSGNSLWTKRFTTRTHSTGIKFPLKGAKRLKLWNGSGPRTLAPCWKALRDTWVRMPWMRFCQTRKRKKGKAFWPSTTKKVEMLMMKRMGRLIRISWKQLWMKQMFFQIWERTKTRI